MTYLMLVVSYAIFALAFALAPWILRQVTWIPLTVGLGAGIIAAAAGILAGARLYPLTDLVPVVVAACGGVLVGRIVPARFRPMAIVVAVLAAVDSIQVFAASNDSHPVSYYYSMLVVTTPLGRAAIGFADLLVVTAVAEHYRRRGSNYWVAAAPGIAGLVLPVLFLGVLRIGLPLLPFVFVGLVLTEVVWARRHLQKRMPTQP
jgi:hypothetical protein